MTASRCHGPSSEPFLARLALHPGQPISSERLIDDLWGDHAPRDGSASLQGLVYRLRRTLGTERRCILRADNGYALDAEVGVDVATFDQLVARARATQGTEHAEEAPALLREALDLWRGPPLAGLESLPFVSTQATRLNAARVAALGDRVDADLEPPVTTVRSSPSSRASSLNIHSRSGSGRN